MISNPIAYGTSSAALVARYEAASDKAATYWEHEEVSPTRKEIKRHYIGEQRHLCCYCGLPDPALHGLDWDAEHIVPKTKHPEFLFTDVNLAVACRECNGNKGDEETLVDPLASTYPSVSDAFHVVHPHYDEWSEHILRDHVTYASFSKKGEWTIKECKLNRFSGREIGLRYPISDSRYEEPVRRFLADEMTLQEIADQIWTNPNHAAAAPESDLSD